MAEGGAEGDRTTMLQEDIRTLQVARSLPPSAVSAACQSDLTLRHMQAHVSNMNTDSVDAQISEVHGER